MASDSIIKDLDEYHRQARQVRRTLEPEWLMNLAMYQGQQWLSFGGSGLFAPQLDSHRITVTEDRIAGAVRTELAKMTKNRPVFVVTPNTGDEEDANAAQLAERLMRFMWKHLKMHELALKALEWSRICGAGFLKCYWDSTIGDQVEVLIGPDGQVVADGSGKPMRGGRDVAQQFSEKLQTQVTSKRIAQGDVKAEVRSPFQMFVDPICDSFPEAEWVIEESIKSVEYVKRRFDVELKADTNANPGLVEARLGSSGVGGSSYKGVKVREYWCKPSSQHSNGCRIVWAQGKVLEQDEKPFDPMPYVMLTGIPVPGRLWPMSIVDLLRGPQTELNKTLSQMAENRNRIANPTGFVSQESVRDMDKFLESISQVGGWYPVNEMSQVKPYYLEAPTLPDYVKEQPDSSRRAMEDLSGQHEVTNAQVPPGVTAASAITLLQEADDTRLGLAMQDYEENLGRFGGKVLKLVARFYTDARTVKIGGDDGAWEIFDFKGAMLRGNTSIDVQAGSSFPQSKAAQQAAIQDWMTFFVQSGNPPHGRQLAQFMRDSGMGSQARMLNEYTTTETQVNRENALMSLGQQLPINPFDDNQGHVDGHQDFQRQPRYPQFAPQIQQGIQQHVDEHKQALAQEQAQQMQQQLEASGQPPPDQQQALAHQQMFGTAQDQQMQVAQAQQQMQGQGLQQAGQAAQADQQRQHAQEQHQQQMQHREQMHEARLAQIRQGGGRGGQ